MMATCFDTIKQIVRNMTTVMDAILRNDGRNIGRNFFRALGEGLIDDEARRMPKIANDSMLSTEQIEGIELYTINTAERR